MIPQSLTINQPQPNQQQQQQPEPTQPNLKIPTPEPTQQANSFVSVDDLLGEFKVEKESTSHQQNTAPATEATEASADPTIPAVEIPIEQNYAGIHNTEVSKPPMDEATAAKETAKFMRFRENLQAYGISWYADGNLENIAQYKYSNAQFNQLVDAWAPVVQQANIKLPPMADIALAELMCTGPLIGLMNANRKYRKQVEMLQKDNAKLQQQVSKVVSTRRDSKRFWEIGTNDKEVYGYFTHNVGGTYLKKEERKERPELTPENIELLVKYNGKAAVDKLLQTK